MRARRSRPAEARKDVARVAEELVGVGVDDPRLRWQRSQDGVDAGEFAALERLHARLHILADVADAAKVGQHCAHPTHAVVALGAIVSPVDDDVSVGREKDSEAAVVPQEVVKQDVVVEAHERPQVEMWSESGHAAVVGAGTRHRKSTDAERATPRRSGCSERSHERPMINVANTARSLRARRREGVKPRADWREVKKWEKKPY